MSDCAASALMIINYAFIEGYRPVPDSYLQLCLKKPKTIKISTNYIYPIRYEANIMKNSYLYASIKYNGHEIKFNPIIIDADDSSALFYRTMFSPTGEKISFLIQLSNSRSNRLKIQNINEMQLKDCKLNIIGKGGSGYVSKYEFCSQIFAIKHISYVFNIRYFNNPVMREIIPFLVIGDHPCFINLEGYCFCRGNLDLVLEYAVNGSLQDKENRHLNSTIKNKLIFGLFYSLRCLHVHGIIHRDIAPHNILFNVNYEMKLCDFGISCLNDQNIEKTKEIGHEKYWAPEIINSAEYEFSVDIYSAGKVIEFISDDLNNKKLLHCLTSEDEKKRPTASDMLILIVLGIFKFNNSSVSEFENYVSHVSNWDFIDAESIFQSGFFLFKNNEIAISSELFKLGMLLDDVKSKYMFSYIVCLCEGVAIDIEFSALCCLQYYHCDDLPSPHFFQNYWDIVKYSYHKLFNSTNRGYKLSIYRYMTPRYACAIHFIEIKNIKLGLELLKIDSFVNPESLNALGCLVAETNEEEALKYFRLAGTTISKFNELKLLTSLEAFENNATLFYFSKPIPSYYRNRDLYYQLPDILEEFSLPPDYDPFDWMNEENPYENLKNLELFEEDAKDGNTFSINMARVLSKDNISKQFLDYGVELGEINCLKEKMNNSKNDEERNYYALALSNHGSEDILRTLNIFCEGEMLQFILWHIATQFGCQARMTGYSTFKKHNRTKRKKSYSLEALSDFLLFIVKRYPIPIQVAHKYLDRAIIMGNKRASKIMVKLFFKGRLGQVDIRFIRKHIYKLDLENRKVLRYMGLSYSDLYNPNNTEQNRNIMFSCYFKAVDKGDSDAMCYLAQELEDKFFDYHLKLLKDSASLGNSLALTLLGFYNLMGHGMDKNYYQAYYYFLLSNNQKNAIGTYAIKYILEMHLVDSRKVIIPKEVYDRNVVSKGSALFWNVMENKFANRNSIKV